MRFFCNQCLAKINHLNRGYVTSCSHVFCYSCLKNATERNACPICKKHCSTIELNKNMPKQVSTLFATTPLIRQMQLIKQQRFHLTQISCNNINTYQTVQNIAKRNEKQHLIEQLNKTTHANQKRTQILIDLRKELRLKCSQTFAKMKERAPLSEVMKSYRSFQETQHRCNKAIASSEKLQLSNNKNQ